MFKDLSQNQKIALGVGAAIGAYFIYTKFINKGIQAEMPTTQSSLQVLEVPNQRRLIGQIRNSIKENNWAEYIDWVSNSSESIPQLRTLSEGELTYLVSTFRKQPYELEPKAKEILSKIIK